MFSKETREAYANLISLWVLQNGGSEPEHVCIVHKCKEICECGHSCDLHMQSKCQVYACDCQKQFADTDDVL